MSASVPFHVDVLGPSFGGKTALVRALRGKCDGSGSGVVSALATNPTMGVEIDELAVPIVGSSGVSMVRLREIGSAMRANWGDYLPMEATVSSAAVVSNRGVLYVLDGSIAGEPFLAEALVDLAHLRRIGGLSIVIAATKADREALLLSEADLKDCLLLSDTSSIPIVRCSAATGKGLEDVLFALARMAT
jgi:hypothetical protein